MELGNDPFARKLALTQAAYFGVTGLWPLFHMRSFEKVTGKKPEPWLVKTVGLLVTAVGGAFAWAARSRRLTPELVGVGVGSAAALAAIDVFYAGKRRISPVYFGDAAAELALIGAWTFAVCANRKRAE